MNCKKLFKILLIPLICILFVQINHAQNKKLDSLKYLLKTAKHDTTKLNIRYEIGDLLEINRIGYYDSLIIDCKKVLSSTTDKRNINTLKKCLANSILSIGYIYKEQDNIPKALEYLHKGLKVSEEIKFYKGIIYALNDIGRIYEWQDDTPKAIEYLKKSLEVSRELGDKISITLALNNIAVTYLKLRDVKALEYLIKTLNIYKEINDTNGISRTYKYIGNLYSILAKNANNKKNYIERDSLFEKSFYYLNKSLKSYESINEKGRIALCYYELGVLYLNLAKEINTEENFIKKDSLINKALDYYFKSLELYKIYGDKPDNVSILLEIGNAYYYKNDYSKALNYALKAYALSIESGNVRRMELSSDLLNKIYFKQQNYKEAYKYYKLEIKYRDSIANSKQIIITQKLQAKYEYGKKAAIDSIASSKAIEMKNLVIRKQKVAIYYFVGGFIVILILLLIILRLFIQKRKASIKLKHQNEEINNKSDELNIKNQLLAEQKLQLENRQILIDHENAQLKTKNLEAENQQLKQQIQPHFLFNSLYTLQILIDSDKNSAKDYLKYLSSFLRVSISSSNVNLVKINEEIKYCIDYLEMQKIRFGNAIQYNINISQEIQNSGSIPIFTIQQLLENCIKHNVLTDKKPLHINIYQNEDKITVSNNLQRKNTEDTSTGVGLKNIEERYRILTGDEIIVNNNDDMFSVSIKIIIKG